MEATDANSVFSITKSIMSALIGIAEREGKIDNLDEPISAILPKIFEDINDVDKRKMTLQHVLTMTGGLLPVDNDYNAYFSSQDWMKYALLQPLESKPGTSFAYNTGLTHLLSGVIAEKTGMDVKHMLIKNFLNPSGCMRITGKQTPAAIIAGARVFT